MADDDLILAAQAGEPVVERLERPRVRATADDPLPCCEDRAWHGHAGCVWPDGTHPSPTCHHGCATCELSEHFHGCPTPTGRPFDCDYCQARALAMSGE